MKIVSIINFKGGVGKTAMTWLLSRYAEIYARKKVLAIDVDAQMSLTTETQLDANTGRFHGAFDQWYDQHKNNKLTIIDALEAYERYFTGKSPYFNFPVEHSNNKPTLIYEVSPNLHMIPSIEDLYWLQFKEVKELYNQQAVENFLPYLIKGKISSIGYDYVFIDCPPNITPLTLSAILASDTILIPVNPDVFASKGVDIMLDVLTSVLSQQQLNTFKQQVRIGVFMNKARYKGEKPTDITQRFWGQVLNVVGIWQGRGWNIQALESFIPDRVAIRDSVFIGRFNSEFRQVRESFDRLWNEMNQKGLV